ncbi:MAG: hypothetical protein KatS3mg113_0923 [Planctomycetaceae bacterium]|nr:MAG: hypothetical protein KatS3mg113_0923 [Planctomycetaceae bacterium]
MRKPDSSPCPVKTESTRGDFDPATQESPGNSPQSTQPTSTWKLRLITCGISFFCHAVILLLCSMIVIKSPPAWDELVNLLSVVEEPPEPITELSPIVPELIDEQSQTFISTSSAQELAKIDTPPSLNVNDLEPQVEIEELDTSRLATIKIGDQTSGRSQAARAALVKKFGGNTASEAAVASGLKWLAAHQWPDGSWSFDHAGCPSCNGKCSQPGTMSDCRTGATGLALLAYLGAGHTHREGDYAPQVKRGLEALTKMAVLKPEGLDLRGISVEQHVHGSYYAQGIATIALCETVALTRDPRYRQLAQSAINFIINSQDPRGGGWRYQPRQPGDTSVVGWQVMALKSGQNARLKIPAAVFRGAEFFLNSVQSQNGALYAYMDPKSPTPSTTAVGLLCRMYLGWDHQHPALKEGIAYLDRTKPATNDMYYNYYATQVMHHWGQEEWKRWNAIMRDRLVNTQHGASAGHLAGSWDVADHHGGPGGRLYMTCLAVMTLEVYYRHLPIYQRENIKVEF